MRKSLLFLLCFVAFSCQRTETAATATATGTEVKTTTVVNPTDAKDLRIDTVVQPVPVFFDTAFLGTQPDAKGNATVDEQSIPQGSTAYFTMHIRESPVGLSTRAVWTDANKKEVSAEERDMNGGKVATFKLATKALKPGKYIVQGYWGGNLAIEKEFEIAAAPKAPAKKKK